jgi:hypothetical protein
VILEWVPALLAVHAIKGAGLMAVIAVVLHRGDRVPGITLCWFADHPSIALSAIVAPPDAVAHLR